MDLKLQQFEGPLDLLLHLIKANKIDIYDIPVFELTGQYIEYLKKMEELNMDIASEFIVMASELLYIKSKMLLPNENKEQNDEEVQDPRAELVRKLVEYKKYTEISGFFKEREMIGFNSYTKPVEKIKGLIKYNRFDMETDSIINVLNILSERVSHRIAPSKETFYPLVEREVVSVSDMEDKLLSVLSSAMKRELVEVFCEICATRAQVTATFMAMLDLIKEEKIKISEEYDDNYEKYMLIML